MERVFSVEEIPDPFWAQPQQPAAGAASSGGGGAAGSGAGAMNRCPSEWSFQKFLEEAVLDSPGPNPSPRTDASGRRGGAEVADVKQAAATSAVVDPVEYNAMLKQKLEKDLAAVAMWRASGAMPPERSAAGLSLSNADVSHIDNLNSIGGNVIPVQNKLGGDPSEGLGPQLVQNADVLVKQVTSPSSREQSDDDDDMEEAETIGNANPAEHRLQRR